MNKNYFGDSQRTQGSTDSYGRGGSQYQYTLGKPVHSGLNKVEEDGETPSHRDKKSTPSPQNGDSQDPSPMRSNLRIFEYFLIFGSSEKNESSFSRKCPRWIPRC